MTFLGRYNHLVKAYELTLSKTSWLQPITFSSETQRILGTCCIWNVQEKRKKKAWSCWFILGENNVFIAKLPTGITLFCKRNQSCQLSASTVEAVETREGIYHCTLPWIICFFLKPLIFLLESLSYFNKDFLTVVWLVDTFTGFWKLEIKLKRGHAHTWNWTILGDPIDFQ